MHSFLKKRYAFFDGQGIQVDESEDEDEDEEGDEDDVSNLLKTEYVGGARIASSFPAEGEETIAQAEQGSAKKRRVSSDAG